MISAASPDDAGDGTLYADPADLQLLEQYAEHGERLHPDVRGEVSGAARGRLRALLSKMVEVDDAPKLDARDWPAAPGFAEQTVTPGSEGVLNVPKHRLRQLRFADGRIVYEAWTPIPRKLAAHEIHLAANGQIPVGSWRLTYHVYAPEWCTCPTARLAPHPHGLFHADCGRLKKPKVEGAFDEHVRSLQFQVDDEAIYNGYYPTLPGQDIAHVNPGAKPGTMAHHQGGEAIRLYNPPPGADPYLRGGTEIRGGRAEHRQRTKGMLELGPGAQKDIDRATAEKKAKQKQATRLTLEKTLQKGPRQIGEL